MRIFGWRLACEHYGGPLFQWVPTHEQAEMFPEIVVAQSTSLAERNFPHVSEYTDVRGEESGLPWNEAGHPSEES